MSRRHALVTRSGDDWVLEDAGGSGTFHDGRRVERVTVTGPIEVRLSCVDGPAMQLYPCAAGDGDTGGATTVRRSMPTFPPGAAQPAAAAQRGIRIGRASDNDLVVDDLLVSRHHAELRPLRAGRYELVDLGSSNGSFVNGRRVERTELEDFDVVGIGHHVFRLVGNELAVHVEEDSIALQAIGLSVRTPDGVALLDDVSFALVERSFMGIVGPSGAGKTTLLNALTGFKPAQQGRIVYEGRDLYAHYDELRTRIGFVPQQNVVHETLTLEQALAYAAELRFPPDVGPGERKARIDEVIEELGLERSRKLAVRHLSGGERRRVAVGLELITKPSLLILDEPTSGLDPGYERSLMELLRRLADGRRTVVVVTHSVQSLRLCDRVLFLAPGGRPAYFGPAQLAPAYFDREDFQEVFRDLSSQIERDWPTTFREHPFYDRYVRCEAPAPAAEEPGGRRFTLPSPRGWFGQFSMLTRRFARVIASDRRNAVLLALQPALLGLVMLLALPSGELSPPDPGVVRVASRGGLVLLVVMLGMTWIGAMNAIREIVREQSIFLRERAVGLYVSAYVASKVAVLGLLTVAQACVLVPIAVARQGGSPDGSVLPWPMLELVLVGALAGLAAMAMGLVISALVRTADRAMTVLPVVLILQMLLAMGGVFPDLVDKPVLQQARYAAGAHWGFTGAASTVDLDRLLSVDRVARSQPEVRLSDPGPALAALSDERIVEPLWQHDAETWAWSAAALVLLSVLGIGATALVLEGRRPEA